MKPLILKKEWEMVIIFNKYIGRILQYEYSDKYKFKHNKFLEIERRLIDA